jgi:hypothetical protein
MKLKTGDIVELKESYVTGFPCAKISFPIDGDDDNYYYLIDAIPCDYKGNEARGFEMGVPMETNNFVQVVGHCPLYE